MPLDLTEIAKKQAMDEMALKAMANQFFVGMLQQLYMNGLNNLHVPREQIYQDARNHAIHVTRLHFPGVLTEDVFDPKGLHAAAQRREG